MKTIVENPTNNVADLNSDLEYALSCEDFKKAEDLIKEGANVNFDNSSLLSKMCLNENNLEIVKFLVEHGANVNAISEDGETILHRIVFGGLNSRITPGQKEMFKFLVTSGAKMTSEDFKSSYFDKYSNKIISVGGLLTKFIKEVNDEYKENTESLNTLNEVISGGDNNLYLERSPTESVECIGKCVVQTISDNHEDYIL